LRRFSFLFQQISNFDAREGWRELLTLFLLLYVYGGDDYLVNLKVVSKTTKCREFTVIFSVFFSKMHRDFADFYRDFLTALNITLLQERV